MYKKNRYTFSISFSLLSTSVVVFTVASLYNSKPVSFSSTMAAIPKVFKRLFVTFLWVSLLMLVYNFVFLVYNFVFLVLLIITVDTQSALPFFLCLIQIFVHVYITALSHLASVVFGAGAHLRVRGHEEQELLKGKTRIVAVLVFGYLSICGLIAVAFGSVVVHGGDKYGVFTRIVVGGFLVTVLVIVNLVSWTRVFYLGL
ncbi:hypothetical protein Tsubulata_019480 [Turnera subulata]|uniref:Transmembrane protein n=1 Tax=Turnera subulata TaxID=218843 RepID=A0A9Q0IYW3_9ROSI|nr:hypothetical protein Tsubulata_019480 [Turnera subulata]